MSSCIGSCLGSCCTSLTCGICHEITPQGGKGSRAPYLALFFITTIVSLVLFYWHGLTVNLYATSFSVCSTDDCKGAGAVYRMGCVLTVFFLTMYCITLCSTNVAEFDYNNTTIKYIYYIALTVGVWFLPESFFDQYAEMARIASIVFLVFQSIIMIDLCHAWQENWFQKDWRCGILSISLASYILSLVSMILLFQYFAKGDCDNEKLIISLTVILTFFFTCLSVSSLSRHGIMPASILTLYAYWMTFSALSSDSNTNCNTFMNAGDTTIQLVFGLGLTALSVTFTSWNAATNESMFKNEKEADSTGGLVDKDTEAGEAVTSTPLNKMGSEDTGKISTPSGSSTDYLSLNEEEAGQIMAAEASAHSRFHFIMAAAAMYMTMLVTSWGARSSGDVTNFSEQDNTSMWVKSATVWLVCLLYVWTFVAPLVLTNRDFE